MVFSERDECDVDREIAKRYLKPQVPDEAAAWRVAWNVWKSAIESVNCHSAGVDKDKEVECLGFQTKVESRGGSLPFAAVCLPHEESGNPSMQVALVLAEDLWSILREGQPLFTKTDKFLVCICIWHYTTSIYEYAQIYNWRRN